MRLLIKCVCFFIFLSATLCKIMKNETKKKFPATIRFTPQIKTFIGKAGNDTSVKVKEIPVPRYARSTKNCRYPSITDDSDIFCKIYPSKISCNQTCMFGHTLTTGIKRTMQCLYNADEWKPVKKFEKCKPFVDCSVALGPGGKMVCHSHFMDHGPICQISCQHYEDKDAVPARKYQCDINGKWHPKLPFCASPGTDIDLVPPPKIRRMKKMKNQ